MEVRVGRRAEDHTAVNFWSQVPFAHGAALDKLNNLSVHPFHSPGKNRHNSACLSKSTGRPMGVSVPEGLESDK